MQPGSEHTSHQGRHDEQPDLPGPCRRPPAPGRGLAGFTDVPVIGMPTRWTTVRSARMAIAAVAALAVAEVNAASAKTKMAADDLEGEGAAHADADH